MASIPEVRFLDRTTPPHIATLILCSGISSLNQTIFLPSLAHMAEHFGTSYAVMQLVLGPVGDAIGMGVCIGLAVVGECLRLFAALLLGACDDAFQGRPLLGGEACFPNAARRGVPLP